jgi:antitoxin (DNA-binding transcriptional repressor) of toxin-antitoxin stability system
MATKTIDMDNMLPAVADLLVDVLHGDEIVVTIGQEPVARIVPVRRTGRRGGFGSLRGQIWMADNFDAPLTDEFE